MKNTLKPTLPQEIIRQITTVTNLYIVKVNADYKGKKFIEWEVHFSDPHNKGLAFTLCFNTAGAVTLLDTDAFSYSWLNIAEGYTSEDILRAARSLIDGTYEIQYKCLGRSRMSLNTSLGNVLSSARSFRNTLQGENSTPHAYRHT